MICFRQGDAPEESRYPIFVTLSLWVECSLPCSHSILALRPQIWAIGSLLDLSLAVEVKSELMLEDLEMATEKINRISGILFFKGD